MTRISYLECQEILKEYGTPEHVVRHCIKVNDVAQKIAKALNKAGFSYDLNLLQAGCLLHDIARVEEKHAIVGAEHLCSLGYDKVAHLVSEHMTYGFGKQLEGMDELDILCIADRLVKEDEYVGLEARMAYVLDHFKDEPEATKRIKEKMKLTEELIEDIEEVAGRSINAIAQDDIIDLTPLLKKVIKPGRYIGGEINAIYKDPNNVSTHFGFAFPDVYEIGMSYTGLQILYDVLNAEEDVYCERIFTPAFDMQELMAENNVPLFTLETKSSVKNLDIVGFTLQYELSYTNIIKMLEIANIPVRSEDRDDLDPFICAGGPCAVNPAPLEDAIDFFIIGDGEEVMPEICAVHAAWDKRNRDEFLKQVSKVEGVYVPKLKNKAKKRILKDIDKARFPLKPIIPIVESVHDRSVVEIFRGCTRGCRFCQAGIIYRPVRERTQNTIESIMKSSLSNTGYDEVSLLSLATNDYSGIETLIPRLMETCTDREVALSLPSLRLDSFSFDVLLAIQKYKKTGLTFAPEAGTQRLRNVINKTITDDDIYSAVRQAIELGWKRMKFYFMIGLPTETVEDLDGIVEISEKSMRIAREIQEKGKRTFSLTISVSNFVPKPHTPFQWFTPNTEEEFKEKNFYLKDKISKVKGASFQYHDTRTSWLEILIARGDKNKFKAIEKAVELGAGFDSWSEHFDYELWQKAFDEVGMDFSEAPKYEDLDMVLPWDVVDTGVSKEFLKKEWDKATREITTRDCRKGCMNCGLECKK